MTPSKIHDGQANDRTRTFRMTISGGLEDFAVRELEEVFPECRWYWVQKGNSGSQLGLEITNANDGDVPVVNQRLLQLRFVEYVYCVVHSQQFPLQLLTASESNDTSAQLLTMIASNRLDEMDRETLEFASNLSRSMQCRLQPREVGLDPLPGELLTVNFEQPVEALPDMTLAVSKPFHVNTIYTRNWVAKIVVEHFLELVQKYTADATETWDPSTSFWLDAGAGSGVLLQFLPEGVRLGIDLAASPAGHPEIVERDFLEMSAESLWNFIPTHSDVQHLCVISNPPFAEGSRGDFSGIMSFLNHATTVLNARFVGLIVPAKFARLRIWASLGMDPRIQLKARFFLPQDSFWDPSSQKIMHIHSYFLFFEFEPTMNGSSKVVGLERSGCGHTNSMISDSVYLQGKRDKGEFADMATAELVAATAASLTADGIQLAPEREAEFGLNVKLQKYQDDGNSAQFDLWLLLNPQRPLSLVNAVSCTVPQHSLGWMSTSVKPAVAHAMLTATAGRLKKEKKESTLVVNVMSGEGTIELESQHFGHEIFMIAGDKSEVAALQIRKRLAGLQDCERSKRLPLVDMVVWDAQNLPIRRDTVDVIIADLPFAGSQANRHQTPAASSVSSALEQRVKYRPILSNIVRSLRSSGKAALISADTKALVHSTGGFNWRTSLGNPNINLGGLNAQLLVMEKLKPCYKDLSVWINSPGNAAASCYQDLSDTVLTTARECISNVCLNELLEIDECDKQNKDSRSHFPSLLTSVKLVDEYFHPKCQRMSHCYRLFLDGNLTNIQAKHIEKRIRMHLMNNPIEGISGFR